MLGPPYQDGAEIPERFPRCRSPAVRCLGGHAIVMAGRGIFGHRSDLLAISLVGFFGIDCAQARVEELLAEPQLDRVLVRQMIDKLILQLCDHVADRTIVASAVFAFLDAGPLEMQLAIEQIASMPNLRAGLLEIEHPSKIAALLSKVPSPFEIHGPRAPSALATDDDPVRRIEDIEFDRTEQRLEASEREERVEARRCHLKLWCVTIVFSLVRHCRTQRHVGRQRLDHLQDVPDPLRQQQPNELRRSLDQVEEISTPRRIDLIVEDIGKRGTEYEGTRAISDSLPVPSERLFPVSRRRPRARLTGAPLDPAKALILMDLSITVIACGADLGATDPRVESVVGPFNFRVFQR